jgi:hypothetical protein
VKVLVIEEVKIDEVGNCENEKNEFLEKEIENRISNSLN